MAMPRSCGHHECPRCVALLLLHKCASTTLLHVLNAPIWRTTDQRLPNTRTRCGGVYYCDWMAYGANACSASSSQPHELADADRAWLYFGGYLPAMAPRIAQRGCRTFALLREPVSRLLSARAYCERPEKSRPASEGGDVLCGNTSAVGLSPAHWAAHWGPYLFRQLALEPSVYASLATSGRASPTPSHPGCATIECTSRSRFTWREQRAAFGANDDGQSTRAGRSALRSLATRMAAGKLFEVIALYEEWDASMELLDATLPLPGGRSWHEQSKTRRQNTGRRHEKAGVDIKEQAKLDAARRDPDVKRPIAADRRLYVAGASWFFALCGQHKIEAKLKDRDKLAESVGLGDAVQ